MNHPDRQDPLSIIALANYLGEPLFTVVAREVFDWDHGARGWLFQRIGCYSVNRGVIDVRSIRTTSTLLKDVRKLFVFPEAHITGDNDRVHELQSSFMHLLLDVQADMLKNSLQKPIYIVPVGVRYQLETDLESSLNKVVTAIEKKLALAPCSLDMEARVIRCAQAILKFLGDQYGFNSSSYSNISDCALALVKHICRRMSEYVGLDWQKIDCHQQWLYQLRHAVAKHLDRQPKDGDYPAKIKKSQSVIFRQFINDLDRVERLMILHRITRSELTDIQLCRVTDFMEQETLGRMTAKGRQTAVIQVSQPICVADYIDLYSASKTTAIETLTTRCKRQMQSALNGKEDADRAMAEVEAQAS